MESSVSVTYVESAAMSQRKKTVIDILRDSHDFVSGEAISDVLGISRNAVHKHVKSLRKRGYRILGVSRRGYRLEDEPCRLSMGHVTERTERQHVRPARSATTTRSSRRTSRPRPSPAAARPRAPWWSPRRRPRGAAASAAAGRRRPARACSSPWSCGRAADERGAPADPRRRHAPPPRRSRRTAARRVAIKWPNDLFIGDRKVGGILMEVAGEQDEVDWVVVGIGLNVNTEFSELPGRAAPHGDVAEDGRRRARGPQRRCSPPCCSASRRTTRGALRGGFESALTRLPRARLPAAARTSASRRGEGPVVGAGGRHRRPRRAARRAAPPPACGSFHSGDVTLQR